MGIVRAKHTHQNVVERERLVVTMGAEGSGIAAGITGTTGHQVTKRVLKPRPASRKGTQGKRVKFVLGIIKEVAGLAPYEKRVCEMLKVGRDKRALKFCKQKLSTHLRAKKKRKDMATYMRAQKTKK